MDEAATEAQIAAENRFPRLIRLIVKHLRAVKGMMHWKECRLQWHMYRGRIGGAFMMWKRHYAAALFLKN